MKQQSLRLSGRALAPGMGQGPAFVYVDDITRFDEFYDIEEGQVAAEVERFQQACQRVTHDLQGLAKSLSEEVDESLSAVFVAHLMMLEDPALQSEIKAEISKSMISAGSAIRLVFRRWQRRFADTDSDIIQHRQDDLQDLLKRLVFSLAGIRSHALESMPEGSVLIAARLLPSDTIMLSRGKAAAAVLESGGQGSHAALFAHEIGLPCVAGISAALDRIKAGDFVQVDALRGEVWVNPEARTKAAFLRRSESRQRAAVRSRSEAQDPALTRGGRKIAVTANIGSKQDAINAAETGADGIGLFRIEQLYLSEPQPLSCEQLVERISDILQPVKSFTISIRLLDVGADKALPYLDTTREPNPALGRRGIRFLSRYPELLDTQLAAVLQLMDSFDLKLLIPMVVLPGDIELVRQRLARIERQTGRKSTLQLGAMIETPAAALTAHQLAPLVDFFSMGTNDLTQYTFAADRENDAVDDYYQDRSEAIYKLLQIVRSAAPQVSLSVCGELASHPAETAKLVRSGIDSLSVAPPAIPEIKTAVRKCD